MDSNELEQIFFKPGDPLKKLLKITLSLLDAEQVGVLYGTDRTKRRFLPTQVWDRGVMDRFDGKGVKGKILKFFGSWIVTFKKLSPVYFYKTDDAGNQVDNDGIISYMLRTCTSYYKQGISILFSPDISASIYQIDNQYAGIPFYSYDGHRIKEPDIKVRVDLNIVRHFQAKNYVSIYIPDYGLLVVNTAGEQLMEFNDRGFVNEKELTHKFDILIQMVEAASLSALGQLKGKKGARLLWRKEQQLRQTSQELVENERKFRDLYENAPIAYCSINKEGKILNFNKNAQKLTGYTRHELLGCGVFDLYVEDENPGLAPEDVNDFLVRGQQVRDVEMKLRHREGRDFWVSLSLDAVRDTHDEIVEVRAMAIDISERKALEKQLLQAQKMEAIGTLAGGIAHDFNNILSPISGYAEMLLMDPEGYEGKKKEHLQIIHDCAQYAKGLVNQMLTFSRQKDNEYKLLQPHVFVKEALALTRSFLPSTIKMTVTINENCGFLMVDPVQAHQVVMNLISNAYHAMEEDGGELSVVLDEAQIDTENPIFPLKPGKYIYLKVADTGPGIPANVLERIFDPFFTTKTEGKGSGIGLSVVHGIIQSHNGYINVVSNPGEGTCFEIYLPAYTGDIRIKEQTEKEDRPICRGSERVLLVDDERKVAFMVQHMLEKLGYQVTCFFESPKAYDLFKAAPDDVDLLITDLTMPSMTGFELAEAVCAIRPELPVILCTGFGEHINKKRYHHKGIKGFLNKPISIKILSHTIRDILDQKQPDSQDRA